MTLKYLSHNFILYIFQNPILSKIFLSRANLTCILETEKHGFNTFCCLKVIKCRWLDTYTFILFFYRMRNLFEVNFFSDFLNAFALIINFLTLMQPKYFHRYYNRQLTVGCCYGCINWNVKKSWHFWKAKIIKIEIEKKKI